MDFLGFDLKFLSGFAFFCSVFCFISPFRLFMANQAKAASFQFFFISLLGPLLSLPPLAILSHISDIKGDIRETKDFKTRIINEYTSEYYANENQDRYLCCHSTSCSTSSNPSIHPIAQNPSSWGSRAAEEIKKFQFLIIENEVFSLVCRVWVESYFFLPLSRWLRSLSIT